MDFQKFDKIPRLSRDIVITEKIDGTNAQIFIISKQDFDTFHESHAGDSVEAFLKQHLIVQTIDAMDNYKKYYMFAGSRTRWLDTSSKGDNFGFAKWVEANAEQLFSLHEGRHYGEYMGKGIQRNYSLDEKRFYLFNVKKWNQYNEEKRLISINPETKEEKYTTSAPTCCKVVPILYKGKFDTAQIQIQLDLLKNCGSKVAPGFKKPEGIVIYHTASGQLFKKTIENDTKPKSL